MVVTRVHARRQRPPRSYVEASADLGASALQTVFLVTLPGIRSAGTSAGPLPFTLGIDEIPVTSLLTDRGDTPPTYT